MFNCEFCKETSKPGERPTRVVTKARDRTYDLGFGRLALGSEIVEEKVACSPCASTKMKFEMTSLGEKLVEALAV